MLIGLTLSANGQRRLVNTDHIVTASPYTAASKNETMLILDRKDNNFMIVKESIEQIGLFTNVHWLPYDQFDIPENSEEK